MSILEGLTTQVLQARYADIGQLKWSVKENLEWLLNTRRVTDDVPLGLKEINRSLAVYGLPDFAQFNPGSEIDRARICEMLKTTIELFEPRLDNVKVMVAEENTEQSNDSAKKPKLKETVTFQITALLKVEPLPEQVRFDTLLQLHSGTYRVEEK